MTFDLKLFPDELNHFQNEYAAITYKLKTGNGAMRDGIKSVENGNKELRIIKKSIDARRKPKTVINYKVEILSGSEFAKRDNELKDSVFKYKDAKINMPKRPVIIGFGPAGMFAGLILARYGLKPLILDRGMSMEDRVRRVEAYKAGKATLDPDNNVQFGEGGAGTFSDGKLHTGISDSYKQFIFDTFVEFGAPSDIKYDSHPHIGTDNLRNVVVNIRKEIQSLGGDILFGATLYDLNIENGKIKGFDYDWGQDPYDEEADDIILAIGHSSRDTFRMLNKAEVDMENKPFSVGVRIEHLRKDIDMAQYGFDTANYHDISSASYKLAVDTVTGRKLYTFCMCPGGEVVAGASSWRSICTNGMSYYARDMENSNSALLVPVDSEIYGEGVLAGIEFQEMLEGKAYEIAGSNDSAPATTFKAFVENKKPEGFGRIKPSYKPSVTPSDLNELFPKIICDSLKDGIVKMGRRINGFDADDAVLTAVEARSSSPVRILRDKESFMSTNVVGLYPCGEGCGYAGGITSSAIDGIKCANALVSKYI
ncbi:MAG: hypothetical protein J6U54_00315 [Clostridiales bacterium]|nr:hypothetical protein [Clostridiales bacterium]